MARRSQDLKRIVARDAELAAEIAAIEGQLAAKRHEREELLTARRVLKRLAGLTEDRAEPDDDDIAEMADVETPPDGESITIGDRVLVLLDEKFAQGMTSTEILEALRKRGLPDLMRTSLSPSLTRMKKKGLIDLEGEYWKLTPENEARSGASETGKGPAVAQPTPTKTTTPNRP